MQFQFFIVSRIWLKGGRKGCRQIASGSKGTIELFQHILIKVLQGHIAHEGFRVTARDKGVGATNCIDGIPTILRTCDC
jgi:hypothetical protein